MDQQRRLADIAQFINNTKWIMAEGFGDTKVTWLELMTLAEMRGYRREVTNIGNKEQREDQSEKEEQLSRDGSKKS